MRIFVYEFVTGGGLVGQPLPPGLVHEADLMVRSLLTDLGEIPGVECFTSRDSRLAPIANVEMLPAPNGEDPFEFYTRALDTADAAWPTAPETGFSLERLGRLTLMQDRVLLGTHPDTVRLTGSKLWTATHLASTGVPVVPTFGFSDRLLNLSGNWVVKPDDGAGAEDMWVVGDPTAARLLLTQKGEGYVSQPWIEGLPMSLSLLCADGRARLLACNRQRISLVDGRVALTAISVNGEASRAPLFSTLASQIAAAIPLLWGHVGVDLILSETGPVVLEINPRLTTSYCGLRRALGHNPASWVLDLLQTGQLPSTPPPPAGTTVELILEAANVR